VKLLNRAGMNPSAKAAFSDCPSTAAITHASAVSATMILVAVRGKRFR
jgi:hypothetical protein